MTIALHWWEGQFSCQFLDDDERAVLRMFDHGQLVWQEPVPSASAAVQRAGQLKPTLSTASRSAESRAGKGRTPHPPKSSR